MTPSTMILGNSLPSVQRSPDVQVRAVAAPAGIEASLSTPSEFAAPTAPAAAHERIAATSPNAIRNPLWVIVIGMACFFAVVALVLAGG
jgi:hypothetical protein